MKRLPAAAMWLGVVLAAAAAAAPAIGPVQVSAEIGRTGAHATIARLARSGQWDGVITRIGEGSDAWLAVAAELAPGSDAGSAEDLGIGLATALPHNAAGVLRTASLKSSGTPIGIVHVCGVPFIEQAAAAAEAYRKQAVTAVSHLRDPSLADRKAICLAALMPAAK